MYNLLKYLYICSFIYFSVLFMYNARTEPYTWTYISSVESVYEKLIETKKNHKMKRNGMKKKPLVPVVNTNRDYRCQSRYNA